MTPLGLTAAALLSFAPPTTVASDVAPIEAIEPIGPIEVMEPSRPTATVEPTGPTGPTGPIGPIEVASAPAPTDLPSLDVPAPKATGTGLLVAAPVFLAAGAFTLPMAIQAGYAGQTEVALGIAGGGAASMAIGATAMYFGVKRNRAWRSWRASRPDLQGVPQSGAGLLVGGGTMVLAGGAGVAWILLAPPPNTGTTAARIGVSAGSAAIGLTAITVGLVRTHKFKLWRGEITSASVAPMPGGAALSIGGKF